MAISSTPTASEINVELGRAATDPFSINGAEERALAQVPSGPITFADFIGKSALQQYTMTAGVNAQLNGYSNYGNTAGSINPTTYNGITISRVADSISFDGYLRFSLQQANLAQTYFDALEITGITDPNWNGGTAILDPAVADLFIADELGNTAWFWTFPTQFVNAHLYDVVIKP